VHPNSPVFLMNASLAKMLATLNVISTGRVDLGIRGGWNGEEYRQ
jgi:alkanesulfonate monooxygenase SsuD/methylene tetrahydromethanopterin reductase-like flavin-dependent oxidoreductase (luciferase family)